MLVVTLSSLQLNANHTHMLASHSRQPSAISVIRVCKLDIYAVWNVLIHYQYRMSLQTSSTVNIPSIITTRFSPKNPTVGYQGSTFKGKEGWKLKTVILVLGKGLTEESIKLRIIAFNCFIDFFLYIHLTHKL